MAGDRLTKQWGDGQKKGRKVVDVITTSIVMLNMTIAITMTTGKDDN